MNLFYKHRILLIVLVVAVILRFFWLGKIPASLNWDEVAFGYNAYSISVNGRDEFGRLLPYDYLESYGDFKPPLYAYATVIPVMLFGLNEFSVRFASAFFGSLTVLATYLLVKRIFASEKQSEVIALFSASLLAVSPWHINLSRAAFEANVATFFLVSGVYFFLEGVQRKKWFLVVSVISFSLSLYTFNTARIVAPLLGIVLCITYWRTLLKYITPTFVAAGVGMILVLPLVPFLFSPNAELRYNEVNIFSNPRLIEISNQYIANNNNATWSKILHNRRVIFAKEYMQHYFDNFNPGFLFISGDENHRFGTKDVGLLYLWELPFIIGGFLYLFIKRPGQWWLIPIWILIGIIPAATARETPHALRIETIVPTLQILSGLGFSAFLLFLSKQKLQSRVRVLGVSIIFFLLFLNIFYYLHGYYKHYGRESAGDWQYGYKEAVTYADQVSEEYDEIHFTQEIGRPYAYVLFYTKTDPEYFRKSADIERDNFGFVNVKSFGKYKFAKDLSVFGRENKKVLSIDVPKRVPENAHILREFRYPDGYVRLVAYTISP